MDAGAVQVQALKKVKYDKVFGEWVPRVGIRDSGKERQSYPVCQASQFCLDPQISQETRYLPT